MCSPKQAGVQVSQEGEGSLLPSAVWLRCTARKHTCQVDCLMRDVLLTDTWQLGSVDTGLGFFDKHINEGILNKGSP